MPAIIVAFSAGDSGCGTNARQRLRRADLRVLYHNQSAVVRFQQSEESA